MKNYNLRCLKWELVTYGNRRNLKDYYFLLSLQTLLPYWAIFERPWDIFWQKYPIFGKYRGHLTSHLSKTYVDSFLGNFWGKFGYCLFQQVVTLIDCRCQKDL